MAFLAPVFFAGLLALAIPIFVHLTYRQKATVVPFPSLMFVRKVPFKSMRRQKIRHWLLFLMRCAALVLLVLAFSRPFFDRAGIAATLSSASREVVILVDNSYSMSYGNRWEDAKEAARDAIDALRSSDRASLVVFSDAAQLAVRSTSEVSVLHGALEALTLTQRPTRYAPGLGVARQVLVESDLPAREVILVTDYQKTGWDADQSAQLPEGTLLTGVDVAPDPSFNLSVASLILQREVGTDGEHVLVTARLTNQGENAVIDREIVLEVDGERVDARSVTLEGNSARNVTFASQAIGAEALRGAIHAGEDALAGDNTFYFMVNPGETLSVLMLTNPRAQDTDGFFVERALAVGTRPAFGLRAKPASQLVEDDLDGPSLVVLNDVAPSRAAAALLRDYVEAGGGLLIALGELTRPEGWQDPALRALAPSFDATIIDRSAEFGGALASYDRNHAVFEVFRAPRSGDFTAASFYRYRKLELGPNDRLLAGFDDGTPALVTRDFGSGRIVVWPTTLDRFWNNLPTQPVFVPFLHRIAQYVAGYQEARAWEIVGGVVRVAGPAGASLPDGTEVSVATPGGGQRALVAGEYAGPASSAPSDQLALDEPGFYELTWETGSVSEAATLAANLDRDESDLAKLDAEELAASVRWRGAAAGDLELGGEITAEDREARQSFWWYLLLTAFGVLALETALSNRLSPSSVTRGT